MSVFPSLGDMPNPVGDEVERIKRIFAGGDADRAARAYAQAVVGLPQSRQRLQCISGIVITNPNRRRAAPGRRRPPIKRLSDGDQALDLVKNARDKMLLRDLD